MPVAPERANGSDSLPSAPGAAGPSELDAEAGGFVLTRLQSVVNWSRRNSVWPLPLGLACCAIEFMATAASRYDMSRFGMEVARFSPRQADLMLVAGWCTYRMASVMTRLYDQMSEPKWVVAMGACASSGGMHRSYPVVQGIDEFLPVDLYIPGCPPRPEAVLNALVQLQKKIDRDRSYRVAREPDPLAPIARGGLRSVEGRGEMAPAVLLSPHERWVEGTKPKVGVPSTSAPMSPAWDLASDSWHLTYRDEAPAAVSPETAKIVAAHGGRWVDDRASGVDAKHRDDPATLVPLASWERVHADLRDRAGFAMLLDHTAVDYPDREPRFVVVSVLLDPSTMRRLLVKTRVADGQPAPSLTKLYPSANWAERETFDMFGIPFSGHPDLTRIYMPQDYDGWPLRRDFPCEGHNRFKD